MRKTFHHILLLIFLAHQVSAQNYYSWQLSDEEGLPSMEIYYLYQDSRAYVWIGTDKGLARYDGHQFEYFQHPEQKGQAVTEIREDHLGQIWYRNFAGQLFYISPKDSVQELNPPKALKLKTNSSYYLLNQKLYIAGNYLGIYDLSSKEWQLEPLPQSTEDASSSLSITNFAAIQNRLYFSNFIGELWERTAGAYKLLGKKQLMVIAPLGQDSLVSVTTDFSQKYYIYSLKDADFWNDDKLPLLQHFKEGVSEEKRIIYLYPAPSGILWLGTSRGAYGLVRNMNGNWEQKYQLMEDAQISSILEDREGNLWLGTLNKGAFIFPSLQIEHYPNLAPNNSENPIHCMAKGPNESLLLGSSEGKVFQFNPQSKETAQIYQGKNSNVTAIVYDPKRQQIIFNAYELSIAPYDQPQNIQHLGGGVGGTHDLRIWKEDLLLMSRKAFINFASLNNGFAKDSIRKTKLSVNCHLAKFQNYLLYNLKGFSKISSIHIDQKDDNLLWVAAEDSLFLLRKDGKKVIDLGGPILITHIHQTTTGEIWLATANKGIILLEQQKVKAHYHQKNGFPANSCSIIKGDQDQLWIGTNKGVIKFNPQTQKSELYNRLDGLPSEDIRDLAILNGKIWVATIKGLISFDLNLNSKNKIPPLIKIKEVFLNREAIRFDQKADFLYHQNDLKFIFQTTAIKGRDAIQYEYRMLGLDSNWIQLPISTNFVQFQGLGHGDYRFEVRALNEDQFASKKIATFGFSIAAPYWQTWWFQLLGYLLLASIIGGFSWWRYQAYKRKQALELSMNRLKMQSLQSQMNPHFVFNAMSAIQDYWIQEDAKTALIYHAQFAKLMRLIFEYSNELSIGIEKELEFLKLYISLEKMRFEKHIEVNFEVNDSLLDEEVELAPLLIQPLIENAFKHGLLHKEGDGEINIQMKNEGDYLYCAIQDNGVGREQAAAFTSWKKQEKGKLSSQHIIKERLDILNQSYGKANQKNCFKISDLDEGTLVEIWIPKIY
jgi:ligand-binding sensor domain-containing protein